MKIKKITIAIIIMLFSNIIAKSELALLPIHWDTMQI